MGAAAESRRAGDRERRLIRAADPELADFLDEKDLEYGRRRAKTLRHAYGLPKNPALEKSKVRPIPDRMMDEIQRRKLRPRTLTCQFGRHRCDGAFGHTRSGLLVRCECQCHKLEGA